jgi:preprotein translocase subunit SecF
MRFFQDADYKFIELRQKAYIVSAAVLAVGILAMLAFAVGGRGWVNYGIDFTGGTMIQVEFAQATTAGELRSALADLQSPEITQFGSPNEYLIRVAEFTEEGTNVSEIISSVLTDTYGAGAFNVVRTEAVGPTIGEELQRKALLAIFLSFGLTLIYLAFRFEWRFGVAAIVATLHDILITLGFISLFRIEVSLPTVAAVLTIIGYSLNDTIVVFDRVRENLKAAGRKTPYIDVINRSINDVLPRTVMTSGTTFLVLLSLYILGGAIIRDFAMILMLGVLIGTYSSIFVASPALLEIEERTGEKHPAPRAPRAKAARA